MSTTTLLATAHLDSGQTRHAQSIRVGRHTLVADEHVELGGTDAGPPPYGLLLAALAACTSITLRMYADHKGWDIGAVHVDLLIEREDELERVARTITLGVPLPPEQRARLAEIAEKTPVTKTLKRAVAIHTTFV